MANLNHQQTPMSSKLTTMLLFLRDDNHDEKKSPILNCEENDITDSYHDQDISVGDIEGIILGGDVCNCRKSKCLKLYCQCFNAARICNDLCRCVSCSNTDSNESGRTEAVKIILDRNPAAFDSKFLSRNTQAQKAAHKSGCKCRKSMCLKKYCECFEASVPCSLTCICVDCRNTSADASLNASRRGEKSSVPLPPKAIRTQRVGRNSTAKKLTDNTAGQIGSLTETPLAGVAIVESDLTRTSPSSESPVTAMALCSDGADDPMAASVSKRVHTDIEAHSKPPLPSSSKRPRRSDPSAAAAASDVSPLCTKRMPLLKPSPDPTLVCRDRDVIRPTMLSRVAGRGRHCSKAPAPAPPKTPKITHESRNLNVTPFNDENIENGATGLRSMISLPSTSKKVLYSQTMQDLPSPIRGSIASSMPPVMGSSSGRGMAVYNKRFVSPNTASVASALSLLSRLPFH